MNTFTITITDAELKALAYAVLDPQDWIDNAVHERCRLAMEEIFMQEVKRMSLDPTVESIPADRETVIMNSDLPTAVERNAQILFSAPFIESLNEEDNTNE